MNILNITHSAQPQTQNIFRKIKKDLKKRSEPALTHLDGLDSADVWSDSRTLPVPPSWSAPSSVGPTPPPEFCTGGTNESLGPPQGANKAGKCQYHRKKRLRWHVSRTSKAQTATRDKGSEWVLSGFCRMQDGENESLYFWSDLLCTAVSRCVTWTSWGGVKLLFKYFYCACVIM